MITPSPMMIVGFAWLAVGFILGTFVAMNRLVHNPELQEKLEDLRKIRYEADRAKTVYHVAKMMDRVNRNLLLSIFEQFDKDLKAHIEKMSKENK